MKKTANIGSLDIFKIVAAFMVIAIHTSPLGAFSETGDFILSRIFCRVAVPFFFMVTGYFSIPSIMKSKNKFLKLEKKLLLIYAVSVAIYLPILVYNHYFSELSVGKFIRDIFFGQMFLHLWYIPAVMLGVAIVVILLKYLKVKSTIYVVIILYVIGLFGNSYYGIIENVTFIKKIYDFIFSVFEVTRNGLFFAPIFILLGYIFSVRDKNTKDGCKKSSQIIKGLSNSILGLIIGSIVLIAEGLVLHFTQMQRADSMYISLVFVMFFLFDTLLNVKINFNTKALRDLSLVIYIIHPMVIVGTGVLAKIIKLTKYLVDNSIINYIFVCVVTVFISIIYCEIKKIIKDKYPAKVDKR